MGRYGPLLYFLDHRELLGGDQIESDPVPHRALCKLRSAITWGLASLGGLVLVLAVAGYGYQALAEARDLRRFPPSGQLVPVDGRLMHIDCRGEGSPTVVIELGIGSVAASWDHIHREAARLTRVCTYDRLGMGYSEPDGHSVRAPDVAARLHDLLVNAGVDDELVLVGWSAGGVYVREFYRQHPDRVRAMLLVDASHEQQALRYPAPPEGRDGQGTLRLASHLAPFGLVRLSGLVDQRFERFPGEETLKARLIALYSQSHVLKAMVNESDAFELDIRADQPPASLGDLPLLVLSEGQPVAAPDEGAPGVTLEYLQERRRVKDELQRELTTLSSRGRQIVAERSGHSIHADQPGLVIDAIRELVALVRTEER